MSLTNSNMTVNDVMERIKQAMKAERTKLGEQENTDQKNNSHSPDKLSTMDMEIRNNNIKWNIVSEWLITSHRKIIGPIIVFGKKLVRKFLRWYINPLTDHQREFNGSVTRSINSIGDLLHDYNGLITSLSCSYDQVISRANGIEETFSQLNGKVNKIENAFSQLNGKVNKIENAFSQLNNKVDGIEGTIKSELAVANDRLRRIERKINSSLNIDISTPIINKLIDNDKEAFPDLDYFLFEQRFRGPREDIKERQKIYLPYFKERSYVLDIGCGRGEFVELMVEKGANVTGIDLNEDMVGFCQDKGLPVKKADALSYLKDLNKNSLDGIFAAQIVEHLSNAEIAKLIRLSYDKLNPNGVIIFETINLQTLLIFANQFYLDPSHSKPIHPQTLEFIMQTEGFKNIKFIFSSPVEDRWIPPLQLEGLNGNIQDFNESIQRLNQLLYGNQDYAIIGYK